MIACPPDRRPWRFDADGPMPMVVVPNALEGMRKAFPHIWIEASKALPTGTLATRDDIA